MHGQAEQVSHESLPSAGFADPLPAPGSLARPPLRASQLPGLGLYLTTLLVEVPAAVLRGILAFLLARAAALLLGGVPDLGVIAYIAALGPFAWSLLALVRPSPGRLWSRSSGARRPSRSEQDSIEAALALLPDHGSRHLAGTGVYVLDHPLPDAVVRGRGLILYRGLLESESLGAVLAHELGHLRSLDGALTEALDRLCLWPVLRGDVEARDQQPPGWIWLVLAALARLAAGGLGERALAPLWAAYWRAREYEADRYAASLGQGDALAQQLSDELQAFDLPQPHLVASTALHPPTALRVERLSEKASS
jgi:Zn-dependent protease with chaperone function